MHGDQERWGETEADLERFPAGFPLLDPQDIWFYCDQIHGDEEFVEERNIWERSPQGTHPGTFDEACRNVQEHKDCVLDPETITRRNRIRRQDYPELDLPELRFYSIVQHEGEVVIHKRFSPHIVVSIGQSFAVNRSFLEQEFAMDLVDGDDREGVRKCECENGWETFLAERPQWDLELRSVIANPKAGIEGHPLE